MRSALLVALLVSPVSVAHAQTSTPQFDVVSIKRNTSADTLPDPWCIASSNAGSCRSTGLGEYGTIRHHAQATCGNDVEGEFGRSGRTPAHDAGDVRGSHEAGGPR